MSTVPLPVPAHPTHAAGPLWSEQQMLAYGEACAAAAREEMRAEVESLRKERDMLLDEVDRPSFWYDDLRRDAERYNYLRLRNRDSVLNKRYAEAGVWCDCENADGVLTLLTGDDLDAAIDAAMEKP